MCATDLQTRTISPANGRTHRMLKRCLADTFSNFRAVSRPSLVLACHSVVRCTHNNRLETAEDSREACYSTRFGVT
jgi:hypothetical protein